MIHSKDLTVQPLLMKGCFGLEKESLRITPGGFLAQTPHPFQDSHIVCDFCENQTEINTDVHNSIEEAMEELIHHTRTIQKQLKQHNELLWPFSSPSLIRNEEDIPVAYSSLKNDDWKYRIYLSNRYGRYKMTFSGIHYNFSLAEELLRADFALSDETDFRVYKDKVYLDLCAKASIYGWLINVLTAASPIVDGSYYEKSLSGHSYFSGMASLRDSELGYWNFFTPVLDFSSLEDYIQSVSHYVEDGFLKQASELYYPIRLKPAGKYSLEKLQEEGISHIELRMIDLNPLEKSGLSLADARFIHLFLIWMICQPSLETPAKAQMLNEQNFKNAAHYDLKTIKIVDFSDQSMTVYDAALYLLHEIRSFCEENMPEQTELVDQQILKLTDPEQYRYAWIIRREFEEDFVGKGLQLARYWQNVYTEAEES